MDRILVTDDPESLRTIAERIDTGVGDPERVRALVVFNVGDAPATGAAVFMVDMPWPQARPFPPVIVRSSSDTVPNAVLGLSRTTDRIAFDLAFDTADVPAGGWKVYWAEFSYAESPVASVGSPHRDLRVVETLCHPGDLPPSGSSTRA